MTDKEKIIMDLQNDTLFLRCFVNISGKFNVNMSLWNELSLYELEHFYKMNGFERAFAEVASKWHSPIKTSSDLLGLIIELGNRTCNLSTYQPTTSTETTKGWCEVFDRNKIKDPNFHTAFNKINEVFGITENEWDRQQYAVLKEFVKKPDYEERFAKMIRTAEYIKSNFRQFMQSMSMQIY